MLKVLQTQIWICVFCFRAKTGPFIYRLAFHEDTELGVYGVVEKIPQKKGMIFSID